MSRKIAQMTVEKDPPRTVVADSTLELKIKSFQKARGGRVIVSKPIQLLDLSSATWTVAIRDQVYSGNGAYTQFDVKLQNFPEVLLAKCSPKLEITCGGTKNELPHYGTCELEMAFNLSYSTFTKHIIDDSINFDIRLLITCPPPDIPSQFCDPGVASQSLLNNVCSMFGDPTFADFTFVIGDQSFKVHKNILAAASPVMRKMFTTDLEEARTNQCTIEAIKPKTFELLLRYLYCCEIPEDLNELGRPLYDAAHYYEIENVKEVCARKIHESLSADNALEVFRWVQPYNLEQLKADAWTIIKRDILEIFVPLKTELLTLSEVNEIIKQSEQEKAFWKKFKKVIVLVE